MDLDDHCLTIQRDPPQEEVMIVLGLPGLLRLRLQLSVEKRHLSRMKEPPFSFAY